MLLMPFSVGEIQIRYNHRIRTGVRSHPSAEILIVLQGVAKLNKSEA